MDNVYNNKLIVCKFGGSSVAKEPFGHKIREIVEENPNRRIIVVSAPGKLKDKDTKITDLLISAYLEPDRLDFYLRIVEARFEKLMLALGVDFDISFEIQKIKTHFAVFKNKSYLFSRGEYLTAKIFAIYLNAKFIDSAKLIKFDSNGKILQKTYKKINKIAEKYKRVVIPGFYGATNFGKIRTMSRGGSDISGAIVSKAIKDSLYENWTDVDGVFSDFENAAKSIKFDKINYQNIKFLSFFGASVLHYKCGSICNQNNTIIKNTFNTSEKGTIISNDFSDVDFAHTSRDGIELLLPDIKAINALIKKLNAEILYKQHILGNLRIGVSLSKGYTNFNVYKSLCFKSKHVKCISIDAYIINDKNLQNLKNKHQNAHIFVENGNNCIFVSYKTST